jgi:competence ComEA-like helix-hairpin-helix protein
MKNVNNVKIKELQKIKGIGQVTAENIVNYRAQIGGFDSLEQLKEVSGVGNKSFSNLEDAFVVGAITKVEVKKIDEEPKEDLATIEFNPAEHNLSGLGEVHLVGDMNDWNPSDKTYALERKESGIWSNSFDLEAGQEYKIMYDSTSWEEDKNVGFYGGNLTVQE